MGGDTTWTDEGIPDWWPYGGEFPDWHVWRGVNGVLYAGLRKSSPPVVVRGEDPVDLRDEIVRADGKRRWR